MRNTLQEAEKYAAEDEANKNKIEAKNGLENYCFTMRNTLQEEKLQDKFEADDKSKIETAVQETLDWLDKNQLAEKVDATVDQTRKAVELLAVVIAESSRLVLVVLANGFVLEKVGLGSDVAPSEVKVEAFNEAASLGARRAVVPVAAFAPLPAHARNQVPTAATALRT